jgi:hypothetical protein
MSGGCKGGQAASRRKNNMLFGINETRLLSVATKKQLRFQAADGGRT